MFICQQFREQPLQAEFDAYTTFTFHFKEEHDLLCNWRSSVPSDVSGTNQIEAKLLE